MRLLPCDEIKEKPISTSNDSQLCWDKRDDEGVDIDTYYDFIGSLTANSVVNIIYPSGYRTTGRIKSVIKNGLIRDCRFNVLTQNGINVTVGADPRNAGQPRIISK